MLLVETVFLASEKQFFYLSDVPGCENCLFVKWKHFLTKASFLLVETDFLSSGKSILKFGGGNSCLLKLIFWLVELTFSHFTDTPSSESYFLSSGNGFLNESSNLYGGDAISVLWKLFSLNRFLFLF